MSKSTRGFVSTVSDWWSEARVVRDIFPWRRARDPWLVPVSEVMLTQTQVSRVAARFEPFIARFPTPKSCATTELSSLLKAWSGLGYNLRAKSLHESARTIVSEFSGRVPADVADLESLGGVGPYVARAVAAFAYDKHVAPIDSNVRRVLERSIAGKPIPMTRAQEIGDALIPRGRSRDWGLALMDFGSLVCSARNPKCAECPVRLSNRCAWRAAIDRQSDDSPDPRTQVRRLGEPFAGSRRDIRGRLLRSACHAPIAPDALVKFAGTESEVDRVREIATRLVEEGLLFRHPMSARSQAAMPSRWLQAVGSS